MICGVCGQEIPEDSVRCPYCKSIRKENEKKQKEHLSLSERLKKEKKELSEKEWDYEIKTDSHIEPIYKSAPFLVFMIIVLPPIGVLLMWIFRRWKIVTRIFVSIIMLTLYGAVVSRLFIVPETPKEETGTEITSGSICCFEYDELDNGLKMEIAE